MTGKSSGVWAGLIAVAAAGYGLGSGWIRLGPPNSDAALDAPPAHKVSADRSATLDPEVVQAADAFPLIAAAASGQSPSGKGQGKTKGSGGSPPPAPQSGVVPPPPVPASGDAKPEPTAAAGSAPTTPASPTTPSAPAGPKPASSIDRGDFQIVPSDVHVEVLDAAKQVVPCDASGRVSSDGPVLTVDVTLDRLNAGVLVPAQADPVTTTVTATLTKPGETTYSPATSSLVFPVSFTIVAGAAASPPVGKTQASPLVGTGASANTGGPFTFTVKESGTYLLTTTKTALGVSTSSSQVLSFQPIHRYPPKIVDVKQTIGDSKATFTDLHAQVTLGNSQTFTADVASSPGRDILFIDQTGAPVGTTATVPMSSSTVPIVLSPTKPLNESPLSLYAIDQWSLDRSQTITVVIPSPAASPTAAPKAKKDEFVEYTEFGRRRKNPDGFNPADKVETRVVPLYYYRDALKVAKIINRDVEVRNRSTVDTRRRLADEARRRADNLADSRRLQDEKAIRAAQDARAAERKLKQAQGALSQADQTAASITGTNSQITGIDAQISALKTRAASLTAELGDAKSSLAKLGDPPLELEQAAALQHFIRTNQAVLDQNAQSQADLAEQKSQTLAAVKSSAATAATSGSTATPADASALVSKTDADRQSAQTTMAAAAADLQAKRQAEAQQSDDLLGLQLQEERAREQQFRDEVAASTTDADIFAAGVPFSDDPVRQVSVTVIGDSLIQLRGPIKGINIIRMMINQIDSPAGQVRIGVHTVQINGEHERRMEDVADKIRHYIDHSRFLTMQSAQMLRKAVVLVASRKAAEVAQQFPEGPADQQQRDMLYIAAFFGRDFLKELCDIDSEFLKTGNKLLSLHSMDSTSLASALFLLALAKNETRREILDTFDAMVRDELPDAEWNYTLAAGPPAKHAKHKGLMQLAGNAKFQSFRGLFDAEVVGDDTLSPIQREFIRMAQIFKSRLVVELEYNQRIMERGLIEDRAGDYEQELINAKRREDDAKGKLRDLKLRVFEQQSQVLGLLGTFNASVASFQNAFASATQLTSGVGNAVKGTVAAIPAFQNPRLQTADAHAIVDYIRANPTVLAQIDFSKATIGYPFRDAEGGTTHLYRFVRNRNGGPDPMVVLDDPPAAAGKLATTLDDVLQRRYQAMSDVLDELGQIRFSPDQTVMLGNLRESVNKLQAQLTNSKDPARFTALTTVIPIYDFYHEAAPLLTEAASRINVLTKAANVLSAELGDQPEDRNITSRRIYQDWNTVQDTYYNTFSLTSPRTSRTLSKVQLVDNALRDSLQLEQQYNFAIQAAQEDRRPIDQKKLLDMLIDQIEEKYIDLLEGTRSHTANIDGYIKTLSTALDDDLNTQFYLPAFREIRKASTLWDVTLGQVETTTILTNNRMFAKVDPSATMEFDLPKRDILINEAMNGAKAIMDDFGALVNDPSFLALSKFKSGQPTSSLAQGQGGASNTVRSVLPGLSRSGDEQLLSQAGSGRREFGSAMEALIPDPAIYKFETGTGFEISPVIQPDGQAVVFDFNYMYTTNVREPVRADEKHLGRVKRHFIRTSVQLSNYELREVSKYNVALKAARTSRGVPLFEDIPGVGVLFHPLPSADSSFQQNIVLAQSTIFPTLFDLMGLRWAPSVADLDTLRLRNDEFVVRQRHKDVENRVFDISSTVVDDALRTAPGQRRQDLYRSQETIPRVHPNGYKGPGLGLRDSQLREGYEPTENTRPERYVPSESRELPRGARTAPPAIERRTPAGRGAIISSPDAEPGPASDDLPPLPAAPSESPFNRGAPGGSTAPDLDAPAPGDSSLGRSSYRPSSRSAPSPRYGGSPAPAPGRSKPPTARRTTDPDQDAPAPRRGLFRLFPNN